MNKPLWLCLVKAKMKKIWIVKTLFVIFFEYINFECISIRNIRCN